MIKKYKRVQWKEHPDFEEFLKNMPFPCPYTWQDLQNIALEVFNFEVSKHRLQERLRYLKIKLGYKTKSYKVGTVRVTTRGRKGHSIKRKEIKLPDGSWYPYHIYLWEQKNGPLPDDCMLIFLDSDSLNCNLDNLFCISKRAKMVYVGRGLYKYKKLGVEALKLSLTLAQLELAIKDKGGR